MLTLKEVHTRVRLALELDQIGEFEQFETVTSTLFTDLVRALAFERCEAPKQACKAVALLLLLEGDDYPAH